MDQAVNNVKAVQNHIAEICSRIGRNAEEICLVAVTKTIETERINEVVESGVIHLGENKVQEILDKYEKLPRNVKWHLIGHLQSNKVKYIIDKVEMIHSVDSLSLAQEIDRRARNIDKTMDILIQINVAHEETKFGIELEEAEDFIRKLAGLDHIRVKGLMTMAPFYEDLELTRPVFRTLKNKFDDLSKLDMPNVDMKILSMGMTNDYAIAIEEGSNLVRIGTGIFGKRNYNL